MVWKISLARFCCLICLLAPLHCGHDDLLQQLAEVRRQLFAKPSSEVPPSAANGEHADRQSGLSQTSSRRPVDRRSAGTEAITEDTIAPPEDDEERKHVEPTWTAEQQLRRVRLASCLATYYRYPVDANKLRPWSIMHGLIAYGPRSLTLVNGQPVNCVEYLCANGAGDGMQILYLENGKLKTRLGPGVQGHEGQLLAILAQAGTPADQPLTVDGQQFTLQDLIEYEMRGCRSGTELTFKLIALAHYLEPDAIWQNDDGETWTMERLIREELAEPLIAGACGGTHRLMALSFAVQQRVKRDLPLEGEWYRADAYVSAVQGIVFNKYQNSDGSFSTLFFKARENHPDLNRRAYATGHIVEWLAYSLPEERLHDQRMTAAVDFLLDLMLTAPDHKVDVGPRGHALHALQLYERRAFGSSSDWANPSNIVNTPLTGRGQFRQANVSSPAEKSRLIPPAPRGVIIRRR